MSLRSKYQVANFLLDIAVGGFQQSPFSEQYYWGDFLAILTTKMIRVAFRASSLMDKLREWRRSK